MDLYIYADESGHSGRMIFNDPPFYFQGAILSVDEAENFIRPVVVEWCQRLGCSRLHANDLGDSGVVAEICNSFIDALDETIWSFHLTRLEKQYLVATKFVDTFFDPHENPAVPFMWYEHEHFRHILCCLFDDALTERAKRQFWEAYMAEDWSSLKAVIRNAKTYLPRYAKDKRLYNVALDALNFVLEFPDEITILTRGRKQYKPHTPNMVGFNSLLLAVRRFAKENNVKPVAFYHDQQSEFGSTMREYHRIFGNVELLEGNHGFLPTAREAEYDLGALSLPSSSDVATLQAVDFFIWVFQRRDTDLVLPVRKRLMTKLDDFHVSRPMSELIRKASIAKLNAYDPTSDEEMKGKELLGMMDNRRKEKLLEVRSRY